jgi:hypothetical protein
VAEATARQTSNGSDPNRDWDQGYGFQFWRCRHNAYRGDGAFGQYCIVMPDQDAVIAITGGLKNMQAVLNLVWDKLLPAMQATALPENEDAHKAMIFKAASLEMRVPQGKATSPMQEQVSKTWYSFPENDRGIIGLQLDLIAEVPAL